MVQQNYQASALSYKKALQDTVRGENSRIAEEKKQQNEQIQKVQTDANAGIQSNITNQNIGTEKNMVGKGDAAPAIAGSIAPVAAGIQNNFKTDPTLDQSGGAQVGGSFENNVAFQNRSNYEGSIAALKKQIEQGVSVKENKIKLLDTYKKENERIKKENEIKVQKLKELQTDAGNVTYLNGVAQTDGNAEDAYLVSNDLVSFDKNEAERKKAQELQKSSDIKNLKVSSQEGINKDFISSDESAARQKEIDDLDAEIAKGNDAVKTGQDNLVKDTNEKNRSLAAQKFIEDGSKINEVDGGKVSAHLSKILSPILQQGKGFANEPDPSGAMRKFIDNIQPLSMKFNAQGKNKIDDGIFQHPTNPNAVVIGSNNGTTIVSKKLLQRYADGKATIDELTSAIHAGYISDSRKLNQDNQLLVGASDPRLTKNNKVKTFIENNQQLKNANEGQ